VSRVQTFPQQHIFTDLKNFLAANEKALLNFDFEDTEIII
jgi:hypothetical protein